MKPSLFERIYFDKLLKRHMNGKLKKFHRKYHKINSREKLYFLNAAEENDVILTK